MENRHQMQPICNGRRSAVRYSNDMKRQTEELQMSAQQTLDELFAESLIPFRLSAEAIESIGCEEYIVRFHDSRLRSVDVSWHQGQSFKDLVRTAVLDRVSRIRDPLRKLVPAGTA